MNFDLGQNLPALITAGVLLLVLVAVLVYAARVAEPGATPRPAGPPTGVVAMERKVAAIVAIVAGVILLLFGYGLREPTRQADAQSALLDTEIERGINNYTTLCFSCHGEKGQGALVPNSKPQQLAPPLDTTALHPSDPDTRTKTYDTLVKTIGRGIPNSPMPAWAQSEGGALIDEDVNDLALMVVNGDRQISYQGYSGTVWQVVNKIIQNRVSEGLATPPAQPNVEQMPFYQKLTPEQQAGVKVILQFGCGGCHTIPNIPGAQGTIGPNEAGVADRRRIAGGAVPNNNQQDLAKWIMNPPALKPGTAMPKLGLSQQQAMEAAAYLYTLHGTGAAGGTSGSAATPSTAPGPSASPAASPAASGSPSPTRGP